MQFLPCWMLDLFGPAPHMYDVLHQLRIAIRHLHRLCPRPDLDRSSRIDMPIVHFTVPTLFRFSHQLHQLLSWKWFTGCIDGGHLHSMYSQPIRFEQHFAM